MKPSQSKVFASLAVMILMVAGMVELGQVQGQTPGTSCTNTFFSSLVQLIPCRAAVSPFSPVPPTETCCSAVKALGQPCLCVLINGPPISGVDTSMALQLPVKCATSFDPCELLRK
ncbi:putative lipid-transfer protein DIR1 [Silene latifolia]|uniref:putative lipid-transfer protein DIR1 n=1 Tax=Silene latifolia TaxID=37657 RepID=UPI003D77B342